MSAAAPNTATPGRRLRVFFATGLGTGLLRPAPGTWGSLACCLVVAGVLWVSGGCAVAAYAAAGAIAVLASAACVALGRFTQETFGRKDPGQCTLDEWAGQAVALLGVPLAAPWQAWGTSLLVCFVAFRVMDIAKPPPVRSLERLPLGWGVLADDLLAGVYANAASQLVLRLWLLEAVLKAVGGRG